MATTPAAAPAPEARSTVAGIGGFLPLELPRLGGFDARFEDVDVALVNTGRNALVHLARSLGAYRVHLPVLGCGVLADALTQHGIDVGWYRIGHNLLPQQLPAERTGELVVLTDLYGMVGERLRALADSHRGSVLDLTHSVLASASTGRPWFASYRKMLGVPDGAIAVGGAAGSELDLALDHSATRVVARIVRLDRGPEAARDDYLAAEAELDGAPIRSMSPLTRRLLEGVDVLAAADRRRRNFELLDELLLPRGLRRIDGEAPVAPFAWPLITDRAACHGDFHAAGVYAPVLWPDVRGRTHPGDPERWAVDHVVPLPVDHHLVTADIEELARRVLAVMQTFDDPTTVNEVARDRADVL